jgi:hypothetical protein
LIGYYSLRVFCDADFTLGNIPCGFVATGGLLVPLEPDLMLVVTGFGLGISTFYYFFNSYLGLNPKIFDMYFYLSAAETAQNYFTASDTVSLTLDAFFKLIRKD